MSTPQFNDIMLLSNAEISDKISEIENKLFDLRFRKATHQNFKAHELIYLKRCLAQLKTLLTLRLQKLRQKQKNKF